MEHVADTSEPRGFPVRLTYAIFAVSGVAAIVYQLLWQRTLFTLFGSDSQSVSVIVSAYMLGLGVGSLGGGWLSTRFPRHRMLLFAAVEASIGLFGLVSHGFFELLRGWTLHASEFVLNLVSFFGVVLPVTLMGATLPLLVAYVVQARGNVGQSVSTLYFVNTAGSAVACLLAALWIFKTLGMAGSIHLAAALNLTLAFVCFGVDRWSRRS